MEIKASTILAAVASCLLVIQTLALPMGGQGEDSVGGNPTLDKRPKYMDTRDLSYFKDLLLYGLTELIDEGKISPSVLGAGSVEPLDSKSGRVDKRRRYMDLCVQVTPGGSYKARPCWKGGSQ